MAKELIESERNLLFAIKKLDECLRQEFQTKFDILETKFKDLESQVQKEKESAKSAEDDVIDSVEQLRLLEQKVMKSSLLQTAIEVVTTATELDKKRVYDAALRLYEHSIHLFLNSIKFEVESERAKQAVRTKTILYLERANKIRKYLKDSDGTGDILSLLGISTTTEGQKRQMGNFDKYLDTILTSVSTTVQKGGFDPFKVNRVMQCRNCTLEGLSLIRRGGPSNLKYANKSLVVDANIHLPALYIHCFPCSEVVLSISISGMVEIVLWDVHIYGKLMQKFERGASPELTEYKVVDEGKLEIDFHSYGWLAPIAEFGFQFIAQRQVSNFIREFIYEKLPSFLVKQLKGFSLPFGK